VNRETAARAYDLIAEGYALLAMAVRDETAGAGAVVSTPRPLAPADDLPPLEEPPTGDQFAVDYEPRGINVQDQHVSNVLSKCPKHDRAWTVKPGGVSKAGKPYAAFWKCSAKDTETRSGYCEKKPVKAWTDAHPAEAAAAAA
jgi:hypothetical protein